MSLQVWLPMTKDLRQQGLSNAEVINNGATYSSTGGKLGGCYSFNRSTPTYLKVNNPITTAENGVSVTFWINLPSNASGNNQIVHIGNGPGWGNNRCTVFVRSGASYLIFSLSGGSEATSTQYTLVSSSLPLNTWTHVACIYSMGKAKIYLNGVLDHEYTISIIPSFNNTSYIGVGAAPNAGEGITCSLNDVRVYDHCLSPMEVKELAKGLVLHYLLSDNSIQELDNCYNYPTFDTSNASGGWSHWGRTGASGTQGQTTDNNYIYRSNQTYAHWVANAASATGEYLLYQSPAFEGGSRSVQCICKEENGGLITNNVVFPVWNARSGGTLNNQWTSIISLGDGFYLCKCEDIQQDGSNDLVGFYVCPGKKVYFSEAYLENDKTVCSNIFYSTNIIYDASGFCNNGNISGTLTVSNDTPKYNYSIQMPAATTITHDRCLDNTNQEWSCAAWVKPTVAGNYQNLNNFNESNRLYHGTYPLLYLNSGTNDYYNYGNLALPANQWSHIVFVFKNSTGTKLIYINGENHTNTGGPNKTSTPKGIPDTVIIGGNNYEGGFCDYREYATALSAEDVKALYNANKL